MSLALVRTAAIPRRRLMGSVRVTGVGLHSGAAMAATLEPMPGGWFLRRRNGVPTRVEDARVVDTAFQTVLALGDERVAGVEHALAAISGLGVDGVCVNVDGDELPALDGSAAPWCDALLSAGLVAAPEPWEAFAATRPVRGCGSDGQRWRVQPAPFRRLDGSAPFDALPPDVPTRAIWCDADPFDAQLAPARTFCFESWLEELGARRLARGGSLENAVVFGRGRVLNPEGLRFPDEPTRHKLLDLLGDLALLGRPLLAEIVVERPGHATNVALVARLRRDPQTDNDAVSDGSRDGSEELQEGDA